MKTWEEAEFAIQQEAIQEWSLEKIQKILRSRKCKKLLAKVTKLARIYTGHNSIVAYVDIEEVEKLKHDVEENTKRLNCLRGSVKDGKLME